MRKVSLILASLLFSAFAFSIPTSATSVTQVGSITSITASCTGQGNADGVLTVSGATTGQTVTLVLTAHKPGDSTFTSTGVTQPITLIDGQTTYSFSLGIPAQYRDSSVYNTLRIEVASSTLTDGTTAKSVSFSCAAAVVTPTPTASASATPSASASASPSASASASPSASASATPTASASASVTVTASSSPAASANVTVAGSQTTPNQQATVAIGAGTTPATQSQIAANSTAADRTTTTNVAGVQSLPSTSTSSAPAIPAAAFGLGLILLGGVILRRAVVSI